MQTNKQSDEDKYLSIIADLTARVEVLESLVFSTKEVLSLKEAAKFIDVTNSTLYKMTHNHEIPLYDYITDPYAGPFPTKEQTYAVNRYMAPPGVVDGGFMDPSKRQLRRFDAHSIVMGAIRILDTHELDRFERVVRAIADDPHYHMPERGSRLGR